MSAIFDSASFYQISYLKALRPLQAGTLLAFDALCSGWEITGNAGFKCRDATKSFLFHPVHEIINTMHPFPGLAKNVVEAYCRGRVILGPPAPLPPELQRRAGVFVSLKKHGELRGCIGTFSPTTENIAAEIIRNAHAAANEDPRFNPVTTAELEQLEYSVDVLSEPLKIQTLDELDPKKYGVIVTKGYRKGLLLPDLEGVDTVDNQLHIAKRKAGIDPADTDVEIYKFTVDRYK